MKELKSRPLSPSESGEVQKRIEDALAKHDRGKPLSEKEWTIVYWVRYAAGCHACGGSSAGVDVAVRRPGAV